MRISAEQFLILSAGVSAVGVSINANVKGSKVSYLPTITVGEGTFEPVDASGRIVSFATLDAVIKWVGRNASSNVTMSVALSILEGAEMFTKRIFSTVEAANLALKNKLTARLTVVSAAKVKLLATKADYEAMGYNTSPLPTLTARYQAVVDQLTAVDENIAAINAELLVL